MTADSEKVRENRLRRMAQRQGLRLERSRRRDPRALGFGKFRLIDTLTGTIAAGGDPRADGFGLTLDDVEQALTGGGA